MKKEIFALLTLIVFILSACGQSESDIAREDCSLIKTAYDNSLNKALWFPEQLPYEIKVIYRDLKNENLRDASEELSKWEKRAFTIDLVTDPEKYQESIRMTKNRNAAQTYIQTFCLRYDVTLLESWLPYLPK
jgi:hypothetical protein